VCRVMAMGTAPPAPSRGRANHGNGHRRRRSTGERSERRALSHRASGGSPGDRVGLPTLIPPVTMMLQPGAWPCGAIPSQCFISSIGLPTLELKGGPRMPLRPGQPDPVTRPAGTPTQPAPGGVNAASGGPPQHAKPPGAAAPRRCRHRLHAYRTINDRTTRRRVHPVTRDRAPYGDMVIHGCA
jgi:hypothetical protein